MSTINEARDMIAAKAIFMEDVDISDSVSPSSAPMPNMAQQEVKKIRESLDVFGQQEIDVLAEITSMIWVYQTKQATGQAGGANPFLGLMMIYMNRDLEEWPEIFWPLIENADYIAAHEFMHFILQFTPLGKNEYTVTHFFDLAAQTQANCRTILPTDISEKLDAALDARTENGDRTLIDALSIDMTGLSEEQQAAVYVSVMANPWYIHTVGYDSTSSILGDDIPDCMIESGCNLKALETRVSKEALRAVAGDIIDFFEKAVDEVAIDDIPALKEEYMTFNMLAASEASSSKSSKPIIF